MPVLKKLLDQQTDPELLDSLYRNVSFSHLYHCYGD
jgi:hypothetical protein